MRQRLLLGTAVLCVWTAGSAWATPISPMSLLSDTAGRRSFAQSVVSYDPVFDVGGQPGPWADPVNALGGPDYANRSHFTSLGLGGTLVLGFGAGALTGSGTSSPDLFVSEVGPDLEDTFGWISTNGRDWIAIGRIAGGTTGVDLDALGYGVRDAFSFLKLQDDPNQGLRAGETVGADIDAVTVVNSAPVPEPATWLLLATGVAGLSARARRKR